MIKEDTPEEKFAKDVLKYSHIIVVLILAYVLNVYVRGF